MATRKQTTGGPPLNWNYGYLWWVAPDDSSRIFMAGADDGQRIYVNQILDLVIVIASDAQGARSGRHQNVDALIQSVVSDAFKAPAPATKRSDSAGNRS
ncbi:hypothetical protein [Ottowia thiooxydans]